MGDLNGGGDDNERPVHLVHIESFALGKTEVTFAEFDAFVRATNRSLPKDEGWPGNRPVINVSWNDAQSYVDWLSNRTGKRFRLPSESEWEYAARAGTTTKFSWGDTPSNLHAHAEAVDNKSTSAKTPEPEGWSNDGFRKKTAPVGQFQANKFGLSDMHGNVYEWVEDCYVSTYLGAPTNGRARTNNECKYRVVRGGSWDTEAKYLRSANRGLISPGARNERTGFRVAQDLQFFAFWTMEDSFDL